MRRWAMVVCLVVTGCLAAGPGRSPAAAGSVLSADSVAHHASVHKALGLHVSGNHFENSRDQTVRLRGFNNSGAEYACIEGWGIFDVDTASDVSVPVSDVVAMTRWSGANAVRVSLNEQCWLGIGGVKAKYGGARYQHAIEAYVRELTYHGFAVILNLEQSAPGNERSMNQEPMPDAHSVTFWAQAAKAFRSDTAVLFDLFNEPWPLHQSHSAKAWKCWRDGGCRVRSQNGGITYTAVGMNQLIAAVRSAGAHNIVLAGGVDYASTLGRWLADKPFDPDHELAAAIHLYSFNGCTTATCYNKTPAAVARHVPLLIGEFGPDLTADDSNGQLDASCPSRLVRHTGFDTTLVRWAQAHAVSWTAFTWNPWGDCWALVKGFSGRPTSPYGVRVRKALRATRQTHRA